MSNACNRARHMVGAQQSWFRFLDLDKAVWALLSWPFSSWKSFKAFAAEGSTWRPQQLLDPNQGFGEALHGVALFTETHSDLERVT